MIDGQNIPHKAIVGFSRDKGVLVGAFEWVFYLLQGKRLDLLFNQVVELFSDIFVYFPILPLLVQELIAAQIPRIEQHVVRVAVLVVFIVYRSVLAAVVLSVVPIRFLYKGQNRRVFDEPSMDYFLEQFQNQQFKYRLLLAMVKHNLKNIVEHLLVLKRHYEQYLVLRVRRVYCRPLFIEYRQIHFPILEELLLRYILKRIEDMAPGVLQGFSIVDLVLELLDVLGDLGLPQLHLLLPPLSGVEFFVVFSEIKASIIQTFDVIFVRDVLACFIELLFASVKLLHFLVQTRQNHVLCNQGLRNHNVEDVFIRVNFTQ